MKISGIQRLVLLGLLLPVLASCSASRSQVGAVAGGTSGVAGCVATRCIRPICNWCMCLDWCFRRCGDYVQIRL